ncbi:protein spindle-F [Coccinella septempunctata]|uniref:protein spindle-F n=1 Tax=Coccinella septempunctata TaxID=41139 RepID=UPI001D076213|nr:protein spindle-F [Coccinella septempunctata]
MDFEEDPNSKEALRIAIRILRERCNTFQKRIGFLEEENKKLKSEIHSYDLNDNSLTEMDALKQRLACAEEQNGFLLHKMKIISQENLQLWSNLGKLTNANKSLGSHLNKINDSLSQHVSNHQPLIRSKTFTQERPTVHDSSEKLDIREEKLGLENVSLKLITNMTDVQNEVDSLTLLAEDFKNIGIFDNVVTSSLGFKCDDEDESNDFNEELKLILKELEYTRDESQRQNKVLKETLQYLEMSKENHLHETKDKSNIIEMAKMCPMCSQQFPEEFPFPAFVSHVESHFKS